MSSGARAAAVLLLAVAPATVGACDDRDALRRPTPGLARMAEQARGDSYRETRAFDDGRVMRRPPPGTVARDAVTSPERPPLTRELLARGRARYDVVCAVCHGVLGGGETAPALRVERKPVTSLHEPRLRDPATTSDAALFDVIANGRGEMPSFADALSPDERWAVVAYVRALQISQHAPVAELPPDLASALATEVR